MNKQFKIYLYLQKDALNLINIHEPLPANWEYWGLQTTTSTPSLIPTHPPVLKTKQNNAHAQAVHTAQQHARTNLTTSLQSKPSECNSHHSSECVAKHRALRSLCARAARERLVSLCGHLLHWIYRTAHSNKDTRAAGVCKRKWDALVTPINLAKGLGEA